MNDPAAELALASSWKRCYSIALRITRNREDAEDAAQAAVAKALEKAASFAGRAQFSTWLTRIAINESLMMLRSRRIRVAREIAVEPRASAATPEELLLDAERRAMFARALAALPADQKKVVYLCIVNGLTAREAGAVTGATRIVVKSRLRRGERRIARIMKENSSPREPGPVGEGTMTGTAGEFAGTVTKMADCANGRRRTL